MIGPDLEYGYHSPREDLPSHVTPGGTGQTSGTHVVPITDQPSRKAVSVNDEGREVEKVVKGIYTGHLNFPLSIDAPPNKTPLTLSATVTSSAPGPIPALQVNSTGVLANQAVVQIDVATALGTTQSFLQCRQLGNVNFKVNAWGSVVAGTHLGGQGAQSNGYAFTQAPTSGMGQVGSTPYPGFWVNNQLGASLRMPVNGRLQWTLEGTGNTIDRPHLAGPFTIAGTDLGVWWNLPSTGNGRMSVVTDSVAVLSVYRNLAVANQSRALVEIGGTIREASSGSHPRLSLVEIGIPTITAGAATVVDATTLYVAGAPTATVLGNNRALWVGGGLSQFDGDLRVIGAFTPNGLVTTNGTTSPAAGASAVLLSFGGTILEAASGNHARLSLAEFAVPTITAGAATVSDATTVYIAGAPAAVVSGKNRALWVAAGETELAGLLTVGGAAAFAGGITVSAGGCDVTGALIVRTDRGLDFRNQTDQAGAAAGTLNNAPAAGDPAVWVPVVVNGTNRAVPAW